MCTGSGAIAVVIAKNTDAQVVATDISEGALQVARANALNVGAKIEFLQSDIFDRIEGKFDVIVSNPPYIPTADIATLDAKVKDFEPALALDGGEDGLKVYRRIADGLEEHLADNGVLLMEMGIGQAQSMCEIFSAYDIEIIKDIEGVDRIALVRRKA